MEVHVHALGMTYMEVAVGLGGETCPYFALDEGGGGGGGGGRRRPTGMNRGGLGFCGGGIVMGLLHPSFHRHLAFIANHHPSRTKIIDSKGNHHHQQQQQLSLLLLLLLPLLPPPPPTPTTTHPRDPQVLLEELR